MNNVMRRSVVVLSTIALGAALGGGTASAHLGGVPGAPNCLGVRTSHAASVHGLTPPERAAIVSGLLGRDVSVGDLQGLVRDECK